MGNIGHIPPPCGLKQERYDCAEGRGYDGGLTTLAGNVELPWPAMAGRLLSSCSFLTTFSSEAQRCWDCLVASAAPLRKKKILAPWLPPSRPSRRCHRSHRSRKMPITPAPART